MNREEAQSGQQTILLSEKSVQQLNKLREKTGKRSLTELVEDAIELHARLRNPVDLESYAQLSQRQREVLKMLAEGQSSKSIASRLKISAKTVEFHRSQIAQRLQIQGIVGLVRYAIRVGAILP